jgi:hypothetical protein
VFEWIVPLIFAVLPAYGDVPCEDLEKAWRTKYTAEFKVTWKSKIFKCPGRESKVAQALWDLEHLKFENAGNGPVPDFYDLVQSHFEKISRDHKEKDADAYSLDRTMTICRGFYKDDRFERAATLVHEARHMEWDDPEHVRCKKGPYRHKEDGCDQTFWDGEWKGSGYNADVYFFAWLRSAKPYNELTRAVINSGLYYLIPERFNEITAEQIKKWRE